MIGTVGTFSEYMVNMAIADDIEHASVEPYKFIVRRDMMFELSWGDYTVRSVTGMIHSWGILRRDYVENEIYDALYRPHRDKGEEI